VAFQWPDKHVLKFLIDECLSLDLVEVAQARGFPSSSHVVWLGKAGWKDWELKSVILAGDWTFVTRNSIDFRGPAKSPGTRGQYANVGLHAGLICINAPDGTTAEIQCELFSAALDEIGDSYQLVNQVIEVNLESGAMEFTIRRYSMPRGGD
jgi:hypothetical protein